MLSVEDLSISFGGLAALRGVSVEVAEREIFALIGPNGAGKSTVFNIITGLERPASGRVRFLGQDLLGLAPHAIARRGVARTFQNTEVFRRLSVLDNVLVGRHGHLRGGALRGALGTASVRRRAQLLALEPTLSIEPLRGNIDTRLRKRGERGLDAVVLAACGLDRLNLAREIGHRFDPEEMVPEAGQGALALQVREGEEHLVGAADHAETRRRVEAERACVAVIGGGCLAPIAAYHDGLRLTALVAAVDGGWIERRSGDDPAEVAAALMPFVAA